MEAAGYPELYNTALKMVLICAGMTQRDLAKRAGIPEAHLSMAMHGKYNLTPQKQDRIAEVLGLPVGKLFR